MAEEPRRAAAVEVVTRCGVHGLLGIGAPRLPARSLARGTEGSSYGSTDGVAAADDRPLVVDDVLAAVVVDLLVWDDRLAVDQARSRPARVECEREDDAQAEGEDALEEDQVLGDSAEADVADPAGDLFALVGVRRPGGDEDAARPRSASAGTRGRRRRG